MTIPALALLVGLSTYYAPGLMQEVANNRGVDLAGYSGVALNDCDLLGEKVWLEWGPGEFTGPHPSVDCAEAGDLALREAQGRVVEVDAETAQAVGFYGVGPRWVAVWFVEPVIVARAF